MATAPKKKATPRKKAAPKAEAFTPYPSDPNAKRQMMSAENQVLFVTWYNTLPKTHQGTIRVFMNMVVSGPLLSDGYRKQATFYRRFLIDRPAEVSF